MKNKTLLFSFLFLSSVAIANQVVQQSNALNLSGLNKNATGTQNGQSTFALDVNVINPTTAPVLVGGSILANQGNAGLSSWPVNVSQVGGSSVMMGQQIAGSSIPVVIASDQSPIPVTGSFSIPGVATAANQVSEILGISTIGTNTSRIPPTGQTTMALSLPVVLASDQSPVQVALSSVVPLPTGAATAALQNTGNTSVGSIDSKTPALGQAVMSASVPVVLASNQTPVQVALSSVVPLPTGAATAALQASGNASLASLDGKVPTQGQTSMALSLPVVLASNQSPVQVSLSSVVPLPTGAATSANQTTEITALQAIQTNTGISTVNSSGSGTSGTVSSVISLSPPLGAVGFVLMNLDTSTANIRWRVGSTATTAIGEQLQPGRSSDYVSVNAAVSVVAESGTQNYDIQWIIK